jgi:hypothetical protein
LPVQYRRVVKLGNLTQVLLKPSPSSMKMGCVLGGKVILLCRWSESAKGPNSDQSKRGIINEEASWEVLER